MESEGYLQCADMWNKLPEVVMVAPGTITV